jgi:hypothetical protein
MADVSQMGVPCLRFDVGNWNIEELNTIITSNASTNLDAKLLFRYVIEWFRSIVDTGKSHHPNHTPGIFIFDVDGLNRTQLNFGATFELMRGVINEACTHYPNVVKHIYIINTSFIFSTFWSIMKSFLMQPIVEKVRIFDKSNLECANASIHSSRVTYTQ